MYGNDDAYYKRVERWASSPSYRVELEALISAMDLKLGARVLDVGCGTGTAMRLFAEWGLDGIGIDRSPSWARLCAARPVAMADAARLPFVDHSFDAAIAMHVFAHLADPNTTLHEVARVLKPGGRLGILTPNRHFLAVYALIPRWWSGYVADATVERHYSAAAVAHLVANAGFRATQATTIGKTPPTLRFAALRERALIVAKR